MRRTITPLTPDEIASILADYSAGMSQGEIARKTGRCRATVHLYVTKAGMSRPPKGLAENTPELVERFAQLCNEGHTRSMAARIVNREAGTRYDASTYRDAMRKLGLEKATALTASHSQPPKTEVVYHDLIIKKTTRMVSAGKAFSLDGVAMVPVSLSAGVRVAA